MFRSNAIRFLIINNGNIIHLIKNPSKPKEPYTVKSLFCLNKLFQIILDVKLVLSFIFLMIYCL